MSLDLYTRYIPLHKKASFWGNYVSALKGKTGINGQLYLTKYNEDHYKFNQLLVTLLLELTAKSLTL